MNPTKQPYAFAIVYKSPKKPLVFFSTFRASKIPEACSKFQVLLFLSVNRIAQRLQEVRGAVQQLKSAAADDRDAAQQGADAALLEEASAQRAAVAHDGTQLQPLFSVIPSGSPFQSQLLEHLEVGRLGWLDWLNQVPFQAVALPSETLLNANCPEDLAALRA